MPNVKGGHPTDAGRIERRQPSSEPLVLGNIDKMANRRAVAILALALPQNDFVALAESVRASTERQPYLPVFLTDAVNLAPLRERSLLFEYLPAEPPPGHLPANYEAFVLARLAIWRRKWCFSRIITAGSASRRRLDRWRTAPNLEPALLDLFTSPETEGR